MTARLENYKELVKQDNPALVVMGGKNLSMLQETRNLVRMGEKE